MYKVKSYKNNKKILATFEKVVTLLCNPCEENEQKLIQDYKDHELIGNLQGYRECHIAFDTLLVYRYDDYEDENGNCEYKLGLYAICNHEGLQKLDLPKIKDENEED